VEKIKYVTDFTVFPDQINTVGTLFGGALLGKMDIAAATLARKLLYKTEAEGAVTACLDKVDFLCPGHLGDLIVIETELKSLGVSSMVIKCTVHREDMRGNVQVMCTAHFTFVAIKGGKKYDHNLSFEKIIDQDLV
jgi:acyl-CoA hydrolase